MRKISKSHLSYKKIYKDIENQEISVLESPKPKCLQDRSAPTLMGKGKMVKPPRFRKGKIIRSLDELMEQEYIFYKGKLYNREWFKFWELSVASQCVGKCQIYSAISLNKVGE